MKTKTANSQQKFLWVCGLLAACSTIVTTAGAQLAAPRIGAEINGAEQSTLKNSLHPLAQAQFDAGRMAEDTRLNGISIFFNRTAGQEASLKALIAAQQNPSSPLYHQWLTPDQFAAQFGMADADLSKVESWLEQQGFSIDSVARSKNAIHFSGTVRQVEQAFSTEMHNYKVNGAAHFAPSTALSVPAALAPTVLGIKNLDDFRPISHAVSRKNARAKSNFTGAGSTNASNETIFFAPGDIKTAYDITPLYNSSVTGTGQSITIVGQSEILNSDIEAFQNASGLAIKDPTPFLVPSSGNPAISAGDESESDLDLEWSGAIAPGATINFVYVGNNTTYSAFDSIQYAIDESIGTIVSSSYGNCEAALGGFTLESFFEQGTAQGQTFLAAAGDDGSEDCNEYQGPGTGTTLTSMDTTIAVDYPASSPYVTGMGGTEINQTNAAYSTVGEGYWEADSGTTDIINSVLQYIPEVVWNDDSSQYGLSASGGGASTLFTKPSWQTGVPGIPADGHRDVPDLALYGSPNFPGYLFCTSDTSFWSSGQVASCNSGFEDSSTGDLTFAGGTSFDGPIFSGMLALINQKQGYTTGQGLINPTLYKLAADSATYATAFHDITTGNNDCTAGSTWCGSTTGGFSAGVGYDQASGLGSVDATVLATAWPANSSTAPVLIATTTNITASNSAPNVNASDNFTISITSSTGAVPSGTLTLTVDTNAPITETFTGGAYIYTTSFSTAGTHTILATYAGDSTYGTSSGQAIVNVATVSSGKGTITLAATPSTLTVAQGSSGNEAVTVTPAGGYTGTVDLNFDTSNDSALQNLCYNWTNINSAGLGTVAITSTAVGTATLTLDANASDCASTAAIQKSGKHALRMLHPRNTAQTTAKSSGRNPLPLTVAFAGLLLVGFMGRSSRKLRGLAALLLLAAVGLAVSACGGVTTTPDSNPPTGTYTVTVSGQDSAGSITATPVTFTFVITGS
jgi:subtilase family serine protease